MRFSSLVSLLTIGAGAAAAAQHSGRSLRHVGMEDFPRMLPPRAPQSPEQPQTEQAQPEQFQYLTDSTRKYAVDGKKIPEVDFDVGESYAGLMPIGKSGNDSSFYFWFFPSKNARASDEILIWLNGGPGCSSLEGLLQENGPFLWQYGTFKPVRNPYTWVNLTNVVWVEQPIGTGFSRGNSTAKDEKDIAAQFLGFWKNFMETFELEGRRIFITGESYAGYYVPYIADAMLNKKDLTYFNLEGTLLYDASLSYEPIQRGIPAVPFVDYWYGLMPFNNSFMAKIHNMSDSCGYTDFLKKYLTFPPPGPFPTKLPGSDSSGIKSVPSCDVFATIMGEVFNVNPCFDVYQVATTCPLLWDVLGFPGSFGYVPAGASIYFNRTDVQKAINAPLGPWSECTRIGFNDQSPPSALSVLPSVIERSQRTIIAHGSLDMILTTNGTLLAIQNMTWNGAQGFTTKPSDPFYVPYHNELSKSTLGSAGVFGTTHTERGLTWVSLALTGHMVPQYAPTASYRHVEYLLGRVNSLTSTKPFSTDNYPQPNSPLGKGTAPPTK